MNDVAATCTMGVNDPTPAISGNGTAITPGLSLPQEFYLKGKNRLVFPFASDTIEQRGRRARWSRVRFLAFLASCARKKGTIP